MKNLFVLLSFALTLSACAGQDQKPTLPALETENETPLPVTPDFKFRASPVFLVAGQSNGVSPAQEHAPYWSQTGKTRVTDYYHGKALRIPTESDPMDGSIAWIYCGDFMNHDVTFVNIAIGSQSTGKWADHHLEAYMVPALQAETFDAVLWIQGESDVGEYFTEEQSYQNMKKVILRSREVQPGLVWFIALNSMRGQSENAPIRKAQKRIIREGLAYVGPDTDKIRTNPDWVEASGAEFVAEGLREHGRVWFKTLEKHL